MTVVQFAVVAAVPAAAIGPCEFVGFNPPVVKITLPEVGIGCCATSVAVTVVFTNKLGTVTVAFPDPSKIIC